MSGGHDHAHSMAGGTLRAAFLLTFVILFVELAGGVLSHSLALLSDAGHVFTDIVALGLAWFATVQAERPADESKTYGYHRIGILAALLNAVTLILIVLAIAYEAVQRFQHPQTVTPAIMFVAAAVGIVVNLAIGAGLHREGNHNLNARAAMLHVFGDVGAAIGVIIGGLIILTTHWYPADPLISLFIAALIAWGAWGILRETIDILMEATPRHLNVAALVSDVVREPGVQDVHDLHVWALAGGMTCLTAHVQVEDGMLSDRDRMVAQIDCLLRERYHIGHTTIQLECAGCASQQLYCEMAVNEHHHAHSHEVTTGDVDVARSGLQSSGS